MHRADGYGGVMTDSSDRPIVLITGGSRGIGAAVAIRLAADGWNIAITYRSRAADAQAVLTRCEALGAASVALQCEMAETDQVVALVPAVLDRFGRIDGLVNNAGITGRIGPFLDVPLDETRTVFDVNVIAPFLLTQHAIARMSTGEGGRGGSIVNISSGAATSGAPGTYIHYAMSKAALNAFTIGLAKEFGPYGVRINTVSPGTTHTEIHAAAGRPNAPEERAHRIPMRRAGQPEEIAGAVAYLMSPAAGYTSGADIRVTGG
jgi:NAD(P)-dependent dehydrogenase (short-subunit alcohol dehydrogenase family)